MAFTFKKQIFGFMDLLRFKKMVPKRREKLAELKQSLDQEALTAGKSIGLRNVVRRMNLIYSDRFSLSIESTLKVGTCFTLRFPYVE